MNYTPADSTKRRHQGFSLVEVVLAIAIAAVGLVAIMGLFPQGLISGQNAADDSLLAIIVQDVIAQRKIDIQTGTGGAALGIPATQLYYFMPDGKETNSTSANLARYKCKMTSTADPVLPLETTQLEIVWPWFKADGTSCAPLNTNIFFTEIAAYR
jgi:uncharacterized protein (TIGR02598 family)